MKRFLAILPLAAAVSCSSVTPGVTPGGSSGALHVARYAAGSSPIQHVVVIVQENRSFDNLFHGFPGANTATIGYGKSGKTFTLVEDPLKWTWDLRHDHPQFLEDYDRRKGDGFEDQIRGFKTGCSDPSNHPTCWRIYTAPSMRQMAYAYVNPAQIQPYWTMAQQYALGDNMFSSNSGPSFVSHQYLIAGESGHASEVPDGQPWGCDAYPPSTTVQLLDYGQAKPPVFSKATGHEVDGPFPCFTYPTIATLLDNAGVSWRYYVASKGSGSNLSAFDAIQAVRDGPDWKNVVTPDSQILKDIPAGNLQQVSWVMPTGSKSDHAGPDSGTGGPDWVASVVNAIGQSPYWNNTAIIVMWDEWGGWYDHVIPPQIPDSQSKAFEGLGFRVPVIAISPYAKAGYVSHVQYEIASSLKFIEDTFALPSLGLADQRADGFDDMFDFTQSPRKFAPIQAKRDARWFLSHPDNTPGDTY